MTQEERLYKAALSRNQSLYTEIALSRIEVADLKRALQDALAQLASSQCAVKELEGKLRLSQITQLPRGAA